MNGVLVIDKPQGLTSHDVVNRVRRILGQRSVGHLGTLDPSATGVLPLVAGNFTRLAQFYTHAEKTYEGAIRFGFATSTYDADGEPTTPPQSVTVKLEEIRALAAEFQGTLQQMSPPFSAKKIAGVPAYKLARKHQEVRLKPVQVEVKEFVILDVEGDRALFRAHVADHRPVPHPGNPAAPDTRPRPAPQPRTTRPQPPPASRPRLPRRPDRPRPAGSPGRLTPPAAITRSNHEPVISRHTRRNLTRNSKSLRGKITYPSATHPVPRSIRIVAFCETATVLRGTFFTV